jgi:hypothetical protein
MSKAKRHLVAFELTAEEVKMLDQRAKQQGDSRSQYLRGCFYFELFMSGDIEAYKFLGRQAGTIMRETLAGKMKELQQRVNFGEPTLT